MLCFWRFSSTQLTKAGLNCQNAEKSKMASIRASPSPATTISKLSTQSTFKSAERVTVNLRASIRKPSNLKLLSIKSHRLKHEDRTFTRSASPSGVIYASTESSNASSAPVQPFRIGHGFDLHRLEPNLPLFIGGIKIPHDRGCEAHSDGDVLLHCIVDAILGALGLPDIGQIFPDNDPKWKGAPSSVFVKEAVKLMHQAGYELGNLDATLILERPKLSPHKGQIQASLCELLGASSSVINIKAKTHEKVDSLGENRSIAAHTIVLLIKK